MRDYRSVGAAMEGARTITDRGVALGRALVLPQVLQPGVDQKHLDEDTGLLRVLVERPRDGAAATAQLLHVAHDGHERGTVLARDLVAHGHHHGSAIERR